MIPATINALDSRVTAWMGDHGVTLLRISLGLVFLWFGFLKFIPGLSPAQDLAARTMEAISFGYLQPSVSIPLLAAWETAIGIGLLVGRALRITILLLLVQMAGTLLPVVLFPGEVFVRIPYAPTLEGQYIFKNLVLISAAIVVGSTVRGGRMVTEGHAARAAEQIDHQERGQVQDARGRGARPAGREGL